MFWSLFPVSTLKSWKTEVARGSKFKEANESVRDLHTMVCTNNAVSMQAQGRGWQGEGSV